MTIERFRNNAARQHRRTRRWGLALLLFALSLTTLACSLRHQQPRPWARYEKDLRPAYVPILELPQLQNAPEYELHMRVDPASRTISGTVFITVTNRTPAPWGTLVLRLYPTLSHYGGEMNVVNLLADQGQLPFTYNETHSALLADLPVAVQPGEQVHLRADYRAAYRRWDLRGYWLFGEREGLINLPLAYPILAVPREDGTWLTEEGIPLGDTLVAESSFYHAWVTVPSTLTLVSSAIVSTTTTYTDTTEVTYELVGGPAREFTLMLYPYYQTAQRKIGDILVRSYYLPGDERAGEAALNYAAAALQVYSRHFGPYPFAKMDVAAAMLLNRGMEYPTLNQLGAELYGDARAQLEFLTAHEVGHQWWYNQVGNDQVREPWLDEGLTEYSTYFYYEDIYGRATAEYIRKNRWEIPVNYVRDRGLDAPLGLPAAAYTRDNYETIVYGKGALFFHTLRQRLGDRMFHRVLRAYLQRYRYRIATARDLQQVIEEVSGQRVDDLFNEWVYGTPSPLPAEQSLERPEGH